MKKMHFKTLLFIIGLGLPISLLSQTTATFTTNGIYTWTCPAGVTSVSVECWGAGGGGAGSANVNNSAGGGGGGGAYVKKTAVAVTPGTTYNITVGLGGTAGAGATSGGNGENSIAIFGATTITANGGNGGTTGGSGAGGNGGSASGGDVNYNGGNGAAGVNSSYGGGGGGGAGTGGAGTTATNGTGGAAKANNGGKGGDGGATGADGAPYAAGGGGGYGKNKSGGAGASGLVLITYTCPTYSLTGTSVSTPIYAGGGTTVTLTGNAANLPVGTYTVTYNLSAPNAATGSTATMVVSSAGIGTFTTSALASTGNTTVTITNLSSGSGTPCSSAIIANNTSVVTVNAAPSYCPNTNGTSVTNYINNFSTTGGTTNITNNGSGFSTNGYQYFSAMTVTQAQNSSVNFSITSDGSTKHFGIWVDWNDDGDFSDTGEEVYIYNTTYSITVSGSFTVPLTAAVGSHRMRVVENDYGNAAACTGTAYSECEDYTINVTALPTCSGTPTGGTSAATVTSGCTGYTSNLSVTGSTVASGITYQWESSADNTSYSAVSGATSATYTATVTSGIYYRRGTICSASGLTGYSTPIQLSATSAPANDLCANATSLPCGTTFLAGHTTCTASESAPTGNSSSYGVWYTFVGNGYTTTISSFANFDHEITIFTGSCGGPYTLEISKDNVGSSSTETYTFIPANGVTYYVYIAHSSTSGTSAQAGSITISRSCIVPCSGTPTAGTATAAATSITCSGSTNVTLSGYSTDTGISFQWQSSPAGTNTWSDIASATTTTLATGTISASTDYRCKVTCANGGAFAYSSTATVTINANAPGRAIASLETVCSGGTTNLSLIGTTISNSTYQWQSSADSLSWSDIGSATASTLTTAAISSNTYFRCKIICTASATSTYSRAVKITVITTSPGNDECTNATVLTVNSSNVCTSSVAGTIQCSSASAEANTCGATLDDDDVWYKFVATKTTHLISLYNIVGSQTDMYIALYSGTCGSLTNFSCLNDDQSTVNGLTIGNTYYARVYTNSSTAGQTTTFNICIGSIPLAPANDECANATTVTVNTTPTCASYVSGTVYSATASAQGSSCGGTDDDDVWYKFVATDTIHNISLTNIYGSTTDMYFTVSSGDCGSLTSLLCSDNNATQIGGLTIGNTYYIRVYTTTSTAGQTSAFDLCVSSIAPTAYCKGADPFCTGTTYNFPTNINAGAGQTGPDYGCLCTQPNPVWYFLRIATAGAIQIEIENSCGDVDYAAWGPFSSITCNPDSLLSTVGACAGNLSSPAGRMIDCAYSIAPIEYLDIPDAKVGEYYLVMINNYANCSGMYTFNKTSGYGCTDCGIVLPVELISFETKCDKDQVEIAWTTASETNSSHFIIEKSLDAKNFVAVANVKAAGNSNQAINYSYTDKEAGNSAYYRLKQFDFDGKYAIYDAKHTKCASLESVELYPNPATTAVTIDHFKGEYLVLNFINLLGQIVYSTEINKDNLKDIDISSLENGYYVVKLMDETGNIKVFHLIKQD